MAVYLEFGTSDHLALWSIVIFTALIAIVLIILGLRA